MNDRGKERPRRKPRPGKRTPPPEDTGREARYLFKAREIQSPMVVELLDGLFVPQAKQIRDDHGGRFPREVEEVPGEGPGLFIRKSEIRQIRAAEGDIRA